MTYESEKEASVLRSFWRPDAPLENTVFVILDPYGRPLIRGARSPKMQFDDSSAMAATMNQIAARYRGNSAGSGLPAVATFRLALNVAACDKRPLAIVVGDSIQERTALEERLAPLAWQTNNIGKVVYAACQRRELQAIRGVNIDSGYLFVAPDLFGTTGTLIGQAGPKASASDLQRFLRHAIAVHNPSEMPSHKQIMLGKEQGVDWQTAIPVTDPHALGHGGRPR